MYMSSDALPMYVHLPVDTHGGKLQPKLQLMIYLGTVPGNERNYLFMHPNNVLYTYAHAVFDENVRVVQLLVTTPELRSYVQ